MIIFWIATPIYLFASIVAFGMGFKRGMLFIAFILGVSLLLYLMFFHSAESALGILVIGVLSYLISKK